MARCSAWNSLGATNYLSLNPLVETINHERMPVLLTTEDEFALWLNGAPGEAMTLAHQFPTQQMRFVQEGEDLLAA